MINYSGLGAILETAEYLNLPVRHKYDLSVDADCMVGKFSSIFADQFGWIIYEDGTHLLNPVKYPYVTGTSVAHTIYNPDGEMHMFWWDGSYFHEVSPEELDTLLFAEYETIARMDQVYG